MTDPNQDLRVRFWRWASRWLGRAERWTWNLNTERYFHLVTGAKLDKRTRWMRYHRPLVDSSIQETDS